MLTLNEQERSAYIAGNIELAAALALAQDLGAALDYLTIQVQEDVEQERATRHLFEAIDDAEELLRRAA